jgi:hypothetical protein
MSRHENSYPDSPIKAVLTFIGDDCGNLGPHFLIQGKDWSMREMPRDQLEAFLNDATGVTNGIRKISEELEQAIFADFADVLERSGNTYKYTGSSLSGKYRIDDSYEAYLSTEGLISNVNSLGAQQRHGDFTPSEAKGVSQNEVALTSGHRTKPVLGSFGAGPCFIVAAYNARTQQALLAHVYILSDLNSLTQYLDKLGGNEQSKIQIHLHGGDDSTRVQANQIIEFIRCRPGAEIVSANICNGSHDAASLAIDARTGDVFTDFRPQQLDLGEDFDARMKILGVQLRGGIRQPFPLRLIYDGTAPETIQIPPMGLMLQR